MFLTWLVRDRERFGFTAAQVAGRLGVSRQEYLDLEAGTRCPSSTVWERMVALYGWPVQYEVWDKLATCYGWSRSCAF